MSNSSINLLNSPYPSSTKDTLIGYFKISQHIYIHSNYGYLGKPIGPTEYYIATLFNNPSLEGLLYGLSIGLKSSIMIFIFI